GVSFFTSFLFSRWLVVIALGFVPLFLFVQKHLVYVLVQQLHAKGYGIERVLIYGSGSTGRRVFSVLRRSPKLGLEPVAFVDDSAAKVGSAIFEFGYENRRSASVLRGPLSRHLVSECAADLVGIATSSAAPLCWSSVRRSFCSSPFLSNSIPRARQCLSRNASA